MSIYLTGVTYKDKKIKPIDDAAVFASVVSDGIATGCELSCSGATLHMAAGKIIACGRNHRVPASLDIPVTGASSGYARLLLTIDLSANLDEQIRLDVEYAQTQTGFPALVQEDINNGGTVYQMVLCRMRLGSGGITEINWRCDQAHARGVSYKYTIPANQWSGRSTVLTCRGVTEYTNIVVTYAPESRAACLAAGVYAVSQGDGTITFACDTLPTEAVKLNVLLL